MLAPPQHTQQHGNNSTDPITCSALSQVFVVFCSSRSFVDALNHTMLHLCKPTPLNEIRPRLVWLQGLKMHAAQLTTHRTTHACGLALETYVRNDALFGIFSRCEVQHQRVDVLPLAAPVCSPSIGHMFEECLAHSTQRKKQSTAHTRGGTKRGLPYRPPARLSAPLACLRRCQSQCPPGF